MIEKVIFESQPKFFVTGLLYLPDAARFKPPYPGVVVPVGHTGNGKAWNEYQPMGALLALNGMAALVFDAIDESERLQYHGERGSYSFDKWGAYLHGTYGHQMIGIGSILLGRNTARIEICDTMRAIDVLQQRPDVDPKRIGCTGHSGGGIVAAYMVALDDRVLAAAPSCYPNHLPTTLRRPGPQDAEFHTWQSMTTGPEAADLLMMRAPVPTLFCEGTHDYFEIGGTWLTFRAAKRLYVRLGFGERMDIFENDAPHNYNQTQREGIARWMSRWLLHKDVAITEPKFKLLSDKEAQCTPEGQVMKLSGAGRRTILTTITSMNWPRAAPSAGRRKIAPLCWSGFVNLPASANWTNCRPRRSRRARPSRAPGIGSSRSNSARKRASPCRPGCSCRRKPPPAGSCSMFTKRERKSPPPTVGSCDSSRAAPACWLSISAGPARRSKPN